MKARVALGARREGSLACNQHRPGSEGASAGSAVRRRPPARVRNQRVGNWRLVEGSSLSEQRLRGGKPAASSPRKGE